MYQALLRAEAPELATAIAFLEQARDMPGVRRHHHQRSDPDDDDARAQCRPRAAAGRIASRPALQAFLKEWLALLRAMKSRVRWSLEVDPLDI
jgi:primosomal protein N' (replication factor Y)